jgi:hypothetical protein
VAQVKPQVIDDEEHERVYERVAVVDVAKEPGIPCANAWRLSSADARWPCISRGHARKLQITPFCTCNGWTPRFPLSRISADRAHR